MISRSKFCSCAIRLYGRAREVKTHWLQESDTTGSS
nr:MAG TPA: hypothetical protein [Caudoviricetes sp.]DAT71263.1 MAG TPA: hypothetical protein [Caudoviricetes sp.]